ncbi:hypothetical protein CTP10_R47150 [Cupriavidus sp. P-10]|uniref:AbiJ-related protein n=1 Tax=Cupriavidus sp. P-10 TaxID=2027911 RepID=UPI000E2F1978|nr:hypothetical protein [Cupriavidus sp. P-10]BDB27310.1 hypothetical protein CTP10_R47150 [Cupriavidus sp. P-10]
MADLVALRRVLAPLISGLKDHATHERLPELCLALGLPPPDPEGSKRDRIEASFAAVADGRLPEVATRLLAQHPIDAAVRNRIQDLIWHDQTAVAISKRVRREVARAIPLEDLYLDAGRFDILLDALWVIEDDPFAALLGRPAHGLRTEIEQHVHRNPGDWSVETLFDRLGAFEASDARFARFLEGLAGADVRPDEAAQRDFVARVNVALHRAGCDLRECGSQDGYPEYRLMPLHDGVAGRPKNLIFASSVKPDLRFRDAINNDIEIVTHADQVLVYDRPISVEGLRWQDLQDWWQEREAIADPEIAKRTLYERLQSSLPESSPPQRTLFKGYHRAFGRRIPGLPALLPEVWLHWDPRTAKQRGAAALLSHRMDFLLLLPHDVRIVIEVDGKHHYAKPDGMASPQRYADMARSDRELKLAGYEVYRFGANELLADNAEAQMRDFFAAMFARYRSAKL